MTHARCHNQLLPWLLHSSLLLLPHEGSQQANMGFSAPVLITSPASSLMTKPQPPSPDAEWYAPSEIQSWFSAEDITSFLPQMVYIINHSAMSWLLVGMFSLMLQFIHILSKMPECSHIISPSFGTYHPHHMSTHVFLLHCTEDDRLCVRFDQ